MTWWRRLTRAFALFCLPLPVIAGFSLLMPEPDPSRLPKTDVIVVLGGGMDNRGVLSPDSVDRVARGVALWQAGLAPRIHFTGGYNNMAAVSSGHRMAQHALAMGVPASAISVETRSRSTLQNALYSKPYLEDADSFRLVTDGFHLPRSWTSFRLMGYQNISLTRANKVVSDRASPLLAPVALGREWLAYWFNLLRGLLWLGLEATGLGSAAFRHVLLA